MIKLVIKSLKWWRGYFRLLNHFCPECNSDAPELYSCPVCRYYRGERPPTEKTESVWWLRFLKKLESDYADSET
jgi:hypothetical protein